MNNKNKKSLLTELDKINYYDEKIKRNSSLCKKVSILSFFIFCFSLIIDSKYDSDISKYFVVAFFLWLIIMFFIRKDYSNKIIYNSGNDSIIKCNNCGCYKYANKKCNNCGFDDSLKEDEKEKLLNFYDKRISLIHILCFVIVALIAFVDIKLIVSIYGNEDNSLALNLFTFGNPSLILIILIVIGLLLCLFIFFVFNSMASSFYIKKKLLIDEDTGKINR